MILSIYLQFKSIMSSRWQIIDLSLENTSAIEQTANLLIEGFQEHWSTAWSDLDSALAEVKDSLTEDKISRIAITKTGKVVGWIGGIKQYQGNVWEIHPLVVHRDYQKQGIGRLLISDLENIVRKKGGLTLWVGTDDEDFQTSIGGKNLYPNVWKHIAQIKNLNNHPYEFYQKCGFVIVGVMPDANGKGKPDIYMAKSL